MIYVIHFLLGVALYHGLLWYLADKESACNAEDPGLIPGPRRCPEEGIGYTL